MRWGRSTNFSETGDLNERNDMNIFRNLFILGRPAAGKSEFIDYMKKLTHHERASLFHIGEFEEVDDFPWIWEACTDDDKREARGEARLYSEHTEEGYNLTVPKFRSSQMGKFNDAILKRASDENFFKTGTLLIEFARGKDDGFMDSLSKIDSSILKDAAVLYIDVSFEESYRKNDARYKKNEKGSILFHKVPDKDMYGFFIENDWKKITDGKSQGYLSVRGVDVPFVSMPNEPESKDDAVLKDRYGSALAVLWQLNSNKR